MTINSALPFVNGAGLAPGLDPTLDPALQAALLQQMQGVSSNQLTTEALNALGATDGFDAAAFGQMSPQQQVKELEKLLEGMKAEGGATDDKTQNLMDMLALLINHLKSGGQMPGQNQGGGGGGAAPAGGGGRAAGNVGGAGRTAPSFSPTGGGAGAGGGANTGATNGMGTNAPVGIGNDLGGTVGGEDVDRLFKAITGKESNGNANAVNADSGALGIGQVMPANVKAWSKEALGYEITPEQFKNSPDLQAKIVRFKLDQYLKEGMAKTGSKSEAIRYAAAKWYSGNGENRNSTRPQTYGGNSYPSIASYSNDVLRRFQAA